MASTWPPKDPDEVLDYEMDWSARLAEDDAISISTWTIVGGGSEVVIDSDSKTLMTTTVWLSGGMRNRSYKLMNHIETTGGRTHEQTATLLVRAK